MKKTLKIFIGLAEITGYYSNLKKGFDQLNIDAVFINSEENRSSYQVNNSHSYANIVNQIFKYINLLPSSNMLLKYLKIILKDFIKLIIFPILLINCDVFIFGFNTTFFYYLDLPILKLFHKKIIYVFNGSDSRPPYLNGVFRKLDTSLLIKFTRQKKRVIKIIENYADYLINIPPQAHFHERRFISGLIIGIPFQTGVLEKNIDREKTPIIRILHAPSSRDIKGSLTIRKIINRLKSRYRFNYVELTNVPNNSVIKEILRSDFIIDELYSDTPMASFSAEAAYFGKPAIIGSYYCDQLLKDVPKKYIPPSIFCHPKKMEKKIELLINNPSFRKEIGEKAKIFAREYWSPKQIASRYLQLINNQFPDYWYFDPQKIDYFYGAAMSKKALIKIIRSIIDKVGVSGLQLNDKPWLEKRFLKFR